MKRKKIKVALVHDYLIAFGGAERVLVALHEIWPEADVFVAIADPVKMGSSWANFHGWKIKTSWFQKIPGSSRLISPLRFLLPLIWESFDFSNYDLVISSSSWAIAKAVITPPETLHVCYCHTPPRFLYGYPQARKWTKYWPVKIYSAFVNHCLRIYDYISSARVDYFIANSKEVAARIKKFYGRDSTVINPPIEIKDFDKRVEKKDFYLFASRLFSYKHPELAISACLKLGRKLIVSGEGALQPDVEKMAAKNPLITYLGRASDKKLWQLYQQAKAFIYPVEMEDFGMMPLEAASQGTPTIALFSGGAKETVLPGKTGVYFKEPTTDSLVEAIKRLEKTEISATSCRKWSQGFSKINFKRKIKQFVLEQMGKDGK